MKSLWTLFSLLLYLASGFGYLQCPRNDKRCLCLPGQESEYHCPPDYAQVGGVVMHVKENEDSDIRVEIDCYGPSELPSTTLSDSGQLPSVTSPKDFDVDRLPNANFGNVSRLEIRFCPLPVRGFKEILEKLSITGLKRLKFGSSDTDSIRLNGSFFEGLETLEELVIEKNKLLILDDDIFDNTPKLTDIELTESNLRISAEVFKRTPQLKSLDIWGNHLEDLPKDLFRHVKNLGRLHIWNNNLTSIDEFVFENLSSLKSLELSNNNINSISENAFRNLKQLTQISLSKNKLDVVPANLFQANPELKKVFMRSNPSLKLPDYLFSNFSLLDSVDLSNCNLNSLPRHIFENSKNLTIVELTHNRLKNLPSTLFKGLQKLKKIELQFNLIEDISNVFASLNKLKELNLEGNSISTIDRDTFSGLKNLERINLRRNQITEIHHNAFDNVGKLKIINISHNKITGQVKNPLLGAIFQNVLDLEDIDLSHNYITQVENVIAIYNKIHLERIDLSYNRIRTISLASLQTVRETGMLVIRLQNNDITTVDFSTLLYIYGNESTVEVNSNNKKPSYAHINLTNNPLTCDCRNYDLLQYFREKTPQLIEIMFEIPQENLTCASPVELQHSLLSELQPQSMVCPLEEMAANYAECPELCACSWRPFDESVIIDCSNKNLLTFPEIILPPPNEQFRYNQTEILLNNNNLTTGPSSNRTDYENVTKLYLSNNKISTMTWVPPGLEVLTLDNNEINNLNYEVLTALNATNLLDLTLYNNPWQCDCETENLTHFLRQHARQVDVTNIYCSKTNTRLIDLYRKDLCNEWQAVYVIVPVMAILLASAILVAFYYRYQKELKIWLFAKNLCLWWVTEEDLDKDKVYDAFISYSHKDEDFVTQNLLPRLEGGPNPYKLCLHYRNWIPGEFIAKQVTNSVLDSRRTLVVLSPNFLESVWGKLEFRTAHTQAMTEGRARVIILLYGDVDVNSLDGELKAYLKTNTYVKWGEPHFWNKLLYALPHSKGGISHINQKHANVMNCIDDKFKLVAPLTASPGSTPPVLTLDANSLKKHPLTFVPCPEMDTPPAEAGKLLTSTCL